jgi:hypothetical protein
LICICLQLFYGELSPPRGLCYRFPTFLRPQNYYSEWLHLGEKPDNDPNICLKYINLTNNQCIFNIAERILAEKIQFDDHGFACSEHYWNDPITVECQNSNVKPFTYQEFTLSECSKFSYKLTQEWCHQFKAIEKGNSSACDLISNSYFREWCYYQVDNTCKKSSIPALRRACEVKKIINGSQTD